MDSLVNLQFLIDDARCFETVRRLRWPEGVRWFGARMRRLPGRLTLDRRSAPS